MASTPVLCERPRDREVSETRLTILSNQDVVLDALSISVGVRQILRFTYRTNAAVVNTRPMKVHEAAAHLCKLLQASSVDYPHQFPGR